MKTPPRLRCWTETLDFGSMTDMEPEKKKCMICGKAMLLIKGGICAPCQERIRREALGEQADTRIEAEKELKRHGVTPDSGTKKQ